MLSCCIAESRDYDIDLVGPTPPDVKWQAKPQTGFEAGQFSIDWQAQQATCPEGHTSISWTPASDNRKHEVIKIKFSSKDWQSCPSRPLCTHSTRYPRRTITVRRQQPHQALQHARARAKTEEFKTRYAQRAGVEGTISEASAGDGTAALSLHRSRKGASSTSGDGCCHEYRAFDALARWGTSCSDEAFPTDSAPPTGCLKYSQGSPAVSNLCQSQSL